MSKAEPFVRVPTRLLEALLRTRLSGAQWHILLWVIRQTFGWNRSCTPFTWYRIAKDTATSRPALYRAGQMLLAARILTLQEGRLAIQTDHVLWVCPGVEAQLPLTLPHGNVAGEQRPPLPGSNESVAGEPPNRCSQATLFRRAKDSSKENRKKRIKKALWADSPRQPFQNGAFSERPHPAGAARPIPGKYDGLSEN
jgi:phage replication O-like protein O